MKASLRRTGLVVALALAAVGAGRAYAQAQNQRLVIKQNGIVLGTIEVPSSVTLRLGTVFSRAGQPVSQLVHLGPKDRPPVVVNVSEGATIAMEQ
jgi:hypothetical protein